jgi:hypothetical protein
MAKDPINTGDTDPDYWDRRFDQLESMVNHNKDEFTKRIRAVDRQYNALMAAIVGLQKNQLRLLGAGSLLGGILISVLSRVVGL